jgi:hypothetical protein
MQAVLGTNWYCIAQLMFTCVETRKSLEKGTKRLPKLCFLLLRSRRVDSLSSFDNLKQQPLLLCEDRVWKECRASTNYCTPYAHMRGEEEPLPFYTLNAERAHDKGW